MLEKYTEVRWLASQVMGYYLLVLEERISKSLGMNTEEVSLRDFTLERNMPKLSSVLKDLGGKRALVELKKRKDWPDPLKLKLENARRRLSSALDGLRARLKEPFVAETSNQATETAGDDGDTWVEAARAERDGNSLDAPAPQAKQDSAIKRYLRREDRREAWVEFRAAQEEMHDLVNTAVRFSRVYAMPLPGCAAPEKAAVASTEEGVSDSKRSACMNEKFVPTDLQRSILKELNGKALRKEPLARAVPCESSRLYKGVSGGLRELMALGKVQNHKRLGYYRPDSPPPELSDNPNGS